ncbi:abortive infection family protein [Serinicoccus sediminis]|uniref:abortive infection family protein n=1 Tax=Serinicoccus sediminis TaxID=2306021 RepID=UPI001021AB97|nr:abortive infection family protein [Serinicoccus sediminis]
MDLFDVTRPEHLDDDGWEAIESARTRLRLAWELNDFQEVVGKAKELTETVAKVVVAAADGTLADNADFGPTVKAAHQSLKRQPGVDLSQDEALRAIAQAAQTMATRLAPLRNQYGTGHGRARVPDVTVEMATVTTEAALLWCRWALRRLGHFLADYPNDLIDAVQTGTTRNLLRAKFQAAALSQQPVEVQHRIGVAFGQQSAGGFGNATEVGVEPAINGGFDEYPIDYRRGLIEGMLLTADGYIGLTTYYASWFVSLLGSLPEPDARALLERLAADVAGLAWVEKWRGSTRVDPAEVIVTLREEGKRLSVGLAGAFDSFCSSLAPDGVGVVGDSLAGPVGMYPRTTALTL